MMYITYGSNWISGIWAESQSTGVLVFDVMDIVRIIGQNAPFTATI